MRLTRRRATFLLGLALLLPASAQAQTGTIEDVEVQGLFRMTYEAFMHAFGVQPGDPYDPATIRRQFRRLWEGGWFEDITVDVEQGDEGG